MCGVLGGVVGLIALREVLLCLGLGGRLIKSCLTEFWKKFKPGESFFFTIELSPELVLSFPLSFYFFLDLFFFMYWGTVADV